MFRLRMPLVGCAIAGLLFALGCSKELEKQNPKAPVVQDMNIVKPEAEDTGTKK